MQHLEAHAADNASVTAYAMRVSECVPSSNGPDGTKPLLLTARRNVATRCIGERGRLEHEVAAVLGSLGSVKPRQASRMPDSTSVSL
jgi:hypothetical protein